MDQTSRSCDHSKHSFSLLVRIINIGPVVLHSQTASYLYWDKTILWGYFKYSYWLWLSDNASAWNRVWLVAVLYWSVSNKFQCKQNIHGKVRRWYLVLLENFCGLRFNYENNKINSTIGLTTKISWYSNI